MPYFRDFMKKVKFSNLNKNEIKFIWLIFNKNYNYEELANQFNVSVDEIKEK